MKVSAFIALVRAVSLRTISLMMSVLMLVFLFSVLLVSVANVFSRALYSTVSLSDRDVVVFSSGSHPYTATTRDDLLSDVLRVVDETRVCPEISVFVKAKNEVFLARAADSNCLVGLGVSPEASEGLESDEAMIGSVLAKHLSVNTGDNLVLESLQSNRSALVKIVSIFDSEGPLGSEIILSPDTARYLRGFINNTYSYIRIVNASESELEELRKITNEPRVRGVIPSLVVNLLRRMSTRTPTYYSKNTVLDPGELASLTRGITLSSLATSIILSLGVLLALPATISRASLERVKALVISGMSERTLIRAFTMVCWLVFLISAVLSLIMYIVLMEAGWLEYRFLFHYWKPELTPVDTLLFFSVASLVYYAGLKRTRGVISWVEEY